MIDTNNDLNCAISSDVGGSTAQFVDINCANPKTALQGRLCYLMSHGDAQRLPNEKIYTWGNRIGLPSSTMKRILDGSQLMQRRVAERIHIHTGADVEWLISGHGAAFSGQESGVSQKPALDNPVAKSETHESIALDLQILELSVETLESVLHLTRRQMSHAQKAKLIVAIYQLYASTPDHHDKMRPTIEQLIRTAA